MNMLQVDYSAVIDAPPETVYNIIADYEVGHRAILPQPYFKEMIIVKGGQGAGTELRLKLVALGQVYRYHQIVSEPEPGRVILEKDLDTAQSTRFIIDPTPDSEKTRITIASEFPIQPGFAGVIQKLIQGPFSRHMFKQELQNLNDYVKQTAPQRAIAS
jgi:hypothetical protein